MVLASISIVSSSSSFLSDSPSTSAPTRTRPFLFSSSNRTPLFGFPRTPLPNATLRASSSSSSSALTPQENGSPEQFLENNSIADFMRFKSGVEGGGRSELQTALVSYRKRFPWSLLRPFLQVPLKFPSS
ncbi:hypothetical protein DEO72_LG5g159 [Vigna unguiculata]|uniref:Uncharacterized protein n=1 Tax=Vigna unguiculata TaxID=3917 RepID=A0A4D6LUH3_VIGUN|nr:hypothetical protein DEO72_LG5g159 [Vigna unguiculata]